MSQFRFQDFSARTLVLAHWGGTLDFTGIPSTAASPVGEWHHYVAVREGSTFRVYVDGEQTWSQTNAQALSFQKTHQLYIGSCFGTIANNAQRYFDGDMDDVRVYDHALDAAEVRGLFEGTSPSLAVPAPVLHYAFEDACHGHLDVRRLAARRQGAEVQRIGGQLPFRVAASVGNPRGGRADDGDVLGAEQSNGQGEQHDLSHIRLLGRSGRGDD